jgi:hypothetical protein
MDFSWSNEQREWYDTIRTFAERKLNNTIQQRDRDHEFGAEEWRLCGEFGLLGLPVPEKYGGLGLDALTTAYAVEAFGRGCLDAGLVFSATAHQFACLMPIVEHGSEELKQRLLPKLSRGEWVGSNGITESESGSDAFLAEVARLSPTATSTSSTARSPSSRTGPSPTCSWSTHRRIPSTGTWVSVPLSCRRELLVSPSGSHSRSSACRPRRCARSISTDVRVPKSNRLNEEGQGANVFKSSMNWERACLFGAWVGVMDRQLEQCVAFAKERRQFGKPIAKYQAISHRIADMKLRLDAARLLLYRACWLKDQGEDSVVEVAMSKIAVSEGVIQSSSTDPDTRRARRRGRVGYRARVARQRLVHDLLRHVRDTARADSARNRSIRLQDLIRASAARDPDAPAVHGPTRR